MSPLSNHTHNGMNMNKVNTKYCRGRTVKPNYRDRVTAQEANYDGMVSASVPTLKVTGETVIDGKKYITLTV